MLKNLDYHIVLAHPSCYDSDALYISHLLFRLLSFVGSTGDRIAQPHDLRLCALNSQRGARVRLSLVIYESPPRSIRRLRSLHRSLHHPLTNLFEEEQRHG
jgi:hypothetical protein